MLAKGKHFILCIVNLNIMSQKRVTTLSVVVKAIAPQLLLLGKDIAVLRQAIEVIFLAIKTAVGIEILALLGVPNVCIAEEVGIIALDIIDYRVTLHLVLIIAHLYTLNADNIFSISVIVTTLRLKTAIIVYNHATTCKSTDIALCIKCKIVGVHRCRAIYNLDNIGVYLRLILLAVILGSIAVNICRTLIYQHTTEALEVRVGVADSAIAGDNRAVMVCREVTHGNKQFLTATLGLQTRIRLHIDILIALLLLLFSYGCSRSTLREAWQTTATRKDDTRCCRQKYQYGYNTLTHYFLTAFTQFLFINSPSRYSGAM